MFVILLLLWLIFSGSLSLSNLITGVVVSALVTFFCTKFVRFKAYRFFKRLRKAPALFRYLLVLIREIIKENFLVLGFIYRKGQPDPQITQYKGLLKNDALRVLVADSITLTPGTYTVRLVGDDYAVHALDRSFDPGIEYNEFFQLARKMEES